MGRYIILLRGINVGGKNRVPMPELKKYLEENGFQDVITYINSGNIIFSSDNTDEKKLKEECEAIILNKFQLNILVGIISAADLLDALDHAPAWWGEDGESKHNAIFVIPPVTAEEVFQEVGEIKPEYEAVDYYGRVIFWSAPVKTFSRTRWSKIVGSCVYDSVTIRNANTVKKISQLV
ncbi:MAG: DUF1697 domain-containing protein [Lacrimispora sp.]